MLYIWSKYMTKTSLCEGYSCQIYTKLADNPKRKKLVLIVIPKLSGQKNRAKQPNSIELDITGANSFRS